MWPDTILKQFKFVDRFTQDETQYYGPYNSVLHDLFPAVEHFQVAPQLMGPFSPVPYRTLVYTVLKHQEPVFFIEIRPYTDLKSATTRGDVDEHQRRLFRELVDGGLTISRLYGVSAMGTCFSIYEYTKATDTLFPPAIAFDRNALNDVAPKERWHYDLLDADGEEKFKAMVADIKAMANDIETKKGA